jgi:hypothetical protein
LSQLATAYTVSSDVLPELALLVGAKKYEQFWKEVNARGKPVSPDYDYSGSVLAIALTCLDEAGLELPLNLSLPAAATIAVAGGLGLTVCANRQDAEQANLLLAEFSVDKGELSDYFESFTGEDWHESGEAMSSAIDFLKNGFSQLLQADSDHWLLVFIA